MSGSNNSWMKKLDELQKIKYSRPGFTPTLQPSNFKSIGNLDELLLKVIASDETQKYVDDLEDLIKGGANVNAKDKDGVTALMLASKLSLEYVVGKLIDNKADVNAKDNYGATALMIASMNGNENIVDFLCKNGADMDAMEYKYSATALMIASQFGHEKIVIELLKKGANPELKNKYGDTALMIASQFGHEKIVRELLKAGADPKLENKYGNTAYSLAKNQAIIQLLSERIPEASPNNIFAEVYPPILTSPNSTRGKGGGKLKKRKRTLKTKKRTLKTKKRR